MTKKLLIIIFLMTFAVSFNSYSQAIDSAKVKKIVIPKQDKTRWFLAGGITTITLLDEKSTLPMVPTDTLTKTIGGSFAGAQSAAELKLTYKLDEDGDFYLPVGLTYFSFSAKEQITINRFYKHNYEHSLSIIMPYVGFYARIIEVPLANAFIYTGIDVQPIFVNSTSFTFKQTHISESNPPFSYKIERSPKVDAFRLGGAFKVGIQGDLIDNWQLNTSFALNSLNLFMKDDARKELLTPSTLYETGESSVNSFIFSLLVQYRLN